ncbi:hypothetical protein [Rhizobium chutanense]|uniref:hypothetical protein n=1 Tax=Rhizobium chutanense TaxID=2035448 RepID=UPI0013E0701C|nr:hypothetical protein [Rhizobium chutanense]
MVRRTMVLTLRQAQVWKPEQGSVLQREFQISIGMIETSILLRLAERLPAKASAF